ncbi:MAG: hypothetical protein WC087_01005 [Candidatus Paceibacterota bacterium]
MIRIEKTNWDFRVADSFESATRDVLGDALEILGFNEIQLYNCQGRQRDVRRFSTTFFLNVFGTADGDKVELTLPDELWKQRVRTCNRTLYQPSGRGIVIVDPESNYAVAELVGKNNLYLLYDASNNCCNKPNVDVYKHILTEAMNLIRGDLPSLVQIKNGKFKIPKSKKDVDLQKQLTENRRLIQNDIVLTSSLVSKNDDNQQAYEEADKVLQTLWNIPEIQNIRVDGRRIIFTTQTMYAVDPGTKILHEFGQFEIKLLFGGGEETPAVFKNLTRRVEYERHTFGHPHVDRYTNQFCMGEGKVILPLLKDYEFEASILVAIKAIGTINEIHYGDYLTVLRKFPVVDKSIDYPKKPPLKDPVVISAFRNLFVDERAAQKQDKENELKKLMNNIRRNQMMIAQNVFIQNLVKVPAAVTTDLFNERIQRVSAWPEVSGVFFKGDDVFVVDTRSIKSRDISTEKIHNIGSFRILCNVLKGLVSISPIGNEMEPDINIPHLHPMWDGGLPIGPLHATLPELLGELDLETVIELVLEFLKEFDGSLAIK